MSDDAVALIVMGSIVLGFIMMFTVLGIVGHIWR